MSNFLVVVREREEREVMECRGVVRVEAREDFRVEGVKPRVVEDGRVEVGRLGGEGEEGMGGSKGSLE